MNVFSVGRRGSSDEDWRTTDEVEDKVAGNVGGGGHVAGIREGGPLVGTEVWRVR